MKISVCIATFNGERYIKDQLDSILPQLSKNDEVIISDDSSTDRTVEIIKSYKNNRIKIFENQKFKSIIFNFENCLSNASGDIIVLADQDDVWKSNKIEIIKRYMNNYDLIVSDADIIDENGNVLHNSFYKLNGSKAGFLKNIIRNSYIGCAIAFNKKILKKSLPFPKDLPMHDWWIGLIGEMYGRTCFIEDKLISYRRHDSNASATGDKSPFSFVQKVLFRLVIIKNLIKRYFK